MKIGAFPFVWAALDTELAPEPPLDPAKKRRRVQGKFTRVHMEKQRYT